MQTDPTALLAIVNAGGIVGFCLLAVFAFVKGWIVPGYMYDREVKRSETLADQVDQNTRAATSALDRLTDEVRSRERTG